MASAATSTPLDQDDSNVIDLRGSTETIENSHVAQKSRKEYIRQLCNFMHFLYCNESYQHLLTKISLLHVANNKDKADYQSALERRRSSSRSRSSRTIPKLDSKNFKIECLRQLLEMKRDSDNSPIKLQGDNCLDYDCVAAYMNTKSKTETVSRELVEQVENSEAQLTNGGNANSRQSRNIVQGDTVKVKVQQSKSTYTSIQSSIAYLYRQNNIERSNDFKRRISTYIAGCTRRCKSHKQQLGLKVTEGKREMNKAAYSILAKYLFESDKMEHVFAHLFLVLDWNLMKRAENCVEAKINHIYFQDDAIVFQFAKSKGHQAGEDHVGPWHVYSNPDEPHLCPVLALARYLFCFPETMKPNAKLFEGTNQYSRYSELFHDAIENCWEALSALGYKEGDFGTHSCRKGVATMVSSGCTVSPPIVSICIRTGWVMGGVKDRYLKYESAGDQYVGQCASGKNPLSKRFAASCPYFDYSHIENESEQLSMQAEITSWLNDRFGKYNTAPETKSLATMCFASICYHFQYLTKHLSTMCPLRASKFFVNIPESFLKCASVRFPWSKTQFTPRVTGIPPHVCLMAEMEELRLVVENLRLGIGNEIDNAFEKHMQCNTEDYRTNCIMKAITDSQSRMEELISGLRAGGAQIQPPNDNNGGGTMDSIIVDEGGAMLPADSADDTNAVSFKKRKNAENGMNAVKKRGVLSVGFHNNRLQVLPVHWEIPKMTFQQMCFNWKVMNKTEKVPPLSMLNKGHVMHLDKAWNKLRKMKSIMTCVEKIAREKEVWYDDRDWTVNQAQTMFEKVLPELQSQLDLNASNRMKELSWKSIYNKMCKANMLINGRGKGNGRGRQVTPG